MPWWLWIALAPYAAVALYFWRPLVGHCAWWQVERWYQHQSKPDGFDWTLAALAGTLTAALWAVIPLLRLLILALSRVGLRLPTIGAERRHEIAEREKRVSQAERELGIR